MNFHYPASLQAADYRGMAYITPRVKLELGARGDPWPAENKIIRPYAAEDFPDFFGDPDTTVTVLSARRTFWEKPTALHAEAHRPAELATSQYFSATIMISPCSSTPTRARPPPLISSFWQRWQSAAIFFRSGWASYDSARPGTLRLVSDEMRSRISELIIAQWRR